MIARCLLLAGSWGPERVPSRPDRDVADWHLPLHVRDAAAARERMAAQIATGADVVVAPTWLTHRRALLPLGESRRAAAWTAAAVRVAREAVEIGLERRESLLAEAMLAEAPPDDGWRSRPDPRVAAVLPAMDEQPEAGAGRLPSREAAGRGHYRDQAGLLADAAPDLLLVEGPTDATAARTAADEAGATGLPVWLAIPAPAIATVHLETWLDWGRQAGMDRLLLPTLEPAAYAQEGGLAWGRLVTGAAEAARAGVGAADAAGATAVTAVAEWLAAGASVVARLDGASVAVLEPLRAAIDDVERTAIEAARASERRWLDHVDRAATMAPGGAALWLGERPTAPLPDGFEWLVADPSEAHRLPAGRYRLIVSRRPFESADDLLEHGGLLALGEPLVGDAGSGLRTVLIDDVSAPPVAIYRREA